MRDKADREIAPRRGRGVQDVISYGLIAVAVVLAWQIILQPLSQRAPVETAIRLAPGSPLVLRRAAESELAAGRVDNAAALSREALSRSPFDVRALRVFGLTEARAGREDEADDILTLAGNWSLRDDPAHAWLVERRLRSGDYVSAFAHADTLVRRRQDLQPDGPSLMDVENRNMFIKHSESTRLSVNPDGLSGSPVFSIVHDAKSDRHLRFDGIVTDARIDRFAVYPSVNIRNFLDQIVKDGGDESGNAAKKK